jgi:hypothetical protein
MSDVDQLLRQVFALCEDTEDAPEREAKNEHQRGFEAGRRFEAKQIRRAIGTWFQDTFCGASHMGEPVIATEAPAVGWVTLWPAMGGVQKPIYSHGSARPSHGQELDARLVTFPVFAAPVTQ